VYQGAWIGYTQTFDKALLGLKLIEIGYAKKTSKIGIINYYIGITLGKEVYFHPQFISIGLSLGVLRKMKNTSQN
jgi:hypothetical protein